MTDIYLNSYWYKPILTTINFVDVCKIKLLEIELFDNLTMGIYKMCLQIIYLIHM